MISLSETHGVPWIDRSLYGPCRARPRVVHTRGARRARSPWPHGRSGEELRFRVGADPAVTPAPFRPTSTTHDSFGKERALPLPWLTPARFPRGRELSVHAEKLTEAGSYRGARGIDSCVAISSVPRTLRHRSLTGTAQVRCSRDPGPAAELRPPASAQAARSD